MLRLALAATAWHSTAIPPLARSLHTTPASYGVMGSIRSAFDQATKRTEDKREQRAFEAQMKFLSDANRPIDGNVYIETMADLKSAAGLSGFREHLPWVQNNPILTDMKREEDIMTAMTDEERRKIEKIGIASKKRISRQSGADLSEVDALVERIVSMRYVQMWVVKQQKAGAPMPRSSAEMQSMLMVPGSGLKRPRSHSKRFPNPGVRTQKPGKRWYR